MGEVNKPIGEIKHVDFVESMSEQYLQYAVSTITSRSLPDVRDGLKPVHRRILYGMRGLKLFDNSNYKKSARVVGDVMGKYHPHGDSSIYDAMVRLSQDFSSRIPFVDGQGNFGNIDGDNPAAMRYTEARLTKAAMLMMEGLDENAVDFRDNYDEAEEEPVVLPSLFPNLLVNGSVGIAVGMAVSIPSHNPSEVLDVALHLIKNPDARLDTLLGKMPGPDFPTGGTIVNSKDEIRSIYETGRGSVRIESKWEKEDLGKGQYQIIVTEIPYSVRKSKLVEKIAELIEDKKVPLLEDVRDESAEDIRLVLEPKNRSVDAETLMAALFKHSELAINFKVNMNALANGRPRVMGLKEIMREWLDHQMEVFERRSIFRLEKIARRLEILRGFVIVYDALDEVIRIIREEDDPKQSLMDTFSLTDIQATAILDMRLRSLRRLEEMKLRDEIRDLEEEEADLEFVLNNIDERWNRVANKIKAVKKEFGVKENPFFGRQSVFGDELVFDEAAAEALIEKEPLTVVCSKNGWIKTLKGHVTEDSVKYTEGDESEFFFHSQSNEKGILVGASGRVWTIEVSSLSGGKGKGDAIRMMVEMDHKEEILAIFPFVSGKQYLMASSSGHGYIINGEDFISNRKAGKHVMKPSVDEKVLSISEIVPEHTHIACLAQNRKLLVFPLNDLPVMKGGKGVTLQKFKDGKLSDIKTFAFDEGLSWSSGKKTRTEKDMTNWLGKRAGSGRLPPHGFPRTGKF